MNWKEWIIPSISKILLTIFMLVLSWFYIYESHISIDAGFIGRGFPLPFYRIEGITIAGSIGPKILLPGLIIDLIIYYLISILVVFIYSNMRKNEKIL